MENNFYIVIMAGGSGTRLWPISRCNLPKQLHNLCSDKSLIQETYERIKDLVPRENIYVSLVKTILKTSQKQLPQILKENFIVEPEAKNTGPAIALVSAIISKKDPEAIIATIASDHTISKVKNYQIALEQTASFVKENKEYLAIVGIQPTQPDTGLGYIKMGRKIPDKSLLEVEDFVEKPKLEIAKKYLASKKYLWNASYFIFSATNMLGLFRKNKPAIYQGIQKIIKALGTKNESRVIEKEYAKFPKIPVDTAIAEKAEKIVVYPADLGWSDIGNWTTLYEFLTIKTGNQTVSRGNHIGIDDKNCLIYAQDKLLTTIGLKDIIVVDTPDVTLVCNKNRAQDIKKLIEKIEQKGKHRYL